jgi:hypothetical protein
VETPIILGPAFRGTWMVSVAHRERVEPQRSVDEALMEQGREPNPSNELVPGAIERLKAELASLRGALLRRGEDRGGLALALDRVRKQVEAVGSQIEVLESAISSLRTEASLLHVADRSLNERLDAAAASVDAATKENLTAVAVLTDHMRAAESTWAERMAATEASFTDRVDRAGVGLLDRFNTLDSSVDRRVSSLSERLDNAAEGLDARVGRLDASVTGRLDRMESSLSERVSGIESSLAERVARVEAASRRSERFLDSLPMRWIRAVVRGVRGIGGR